MGAVSTILSIAFHTDGSTLTGTQGGIIYQWADGGEQCIQKFEALHQGPVHDIFVNDDYILTGGKDGKVNFFTQYMEKVFNKQAAKPLLPAIKDKLPSDADMTMLQARERSHS